MKMARDKHDCQKNGRIQRYGHNDLKNTGLSTCAHARADMKRDAAAAIGRLASQAM